MDSPTPNLDEDIPNIRKRKRSPLKEESEDESCAGRSATETRDSVTPGTPLGSDMETSHKRPRLQDATNPPRAEATPGPAAKEIPRVPELPLEVWRYICSFLEPVSLGRLIRVNRMLNALLDPDKPVPEPMRSKGLTQNDIWSISRKRLLPGFPRPLSWLSELDIWKLLLGTTCQFCERKPSRPSSMTPSPWTSGPGKDGVRIVWPFAVRSCGKCLTTRITKDADLRFSDASILLPGLSYAYLTSDLNFVTSIALRASSPPLGIDLTRYYLQSQVDQLKQNMDHHASSLGRPAAEEWVKGLDHVGRQKMEDAKRFEHWEATGGLQALLRSKAKNASSPKRALPAKLVSPALSLPGMPARVQVQPNPAHSRTQSPFSAQYRPSPSVINHLSGFSTPHLPLKPASPAPGQVPSAHLQPGTPMTHSQGPRGRSERNVGDMNQRKAERRVEIERRCLQLDPPIKSSTLPYMEAFNNAMQIPMALNDKAWEVLKPRLVAQHELASKTEKEFHNVNKTFQSQAEQRRENEEELRQAQILLQRQRDEAQRPVREKLASYADELIRSDWSDGAGVFKENAPQFAADLLIYVRRKFFEALDESDELLGAQGPLSVSSLHRDGTDRHLTLEDMKWVYENKIKSITQRFSKEIFLCGACDIDRKHYALDAVIQHYAAKHTNSFSHGSATVYWKADWPLEPPFDPKPIRSPRSRTLDHNGVSPMYQREFGRAQLMEPVFALPEQTPAYSARPVAAMTPDLASRPLARYAASAYSVDEEIYPPRFVSRTTGIPRPGPYGNGAYETYYVPVIPTSPAFSAQGLTRGSYRERVPEPYQHPYPVRRYDSSTMSPAGMNGHAPPPQAIQNSRSDLRPFTQPGQPSGLHQTQIADLARNAREIWDDTTGINDLSDSLRTHVIIHHVVLRFRERYTNEPTLALFTDALLNTSQMKPLMDLEALACRACTSHHHEHASSNHRGSQYNLPGLLKHFQTMHMESSSPPLTAHSGLDTLRPDWKFDMVQLPDERSIKNLAHFPGMTDFKLNLIATVLPRYFPHPLPRLDRAPEMVRTSTTVLPTDEATEPLARLASPSLSPGSPRNFLPLEEPTANIEHLLAVSGLDRPNAELPIEEAIRDDEYDPHRPAPTQPAPIPGYAYDQPELLHREPPRSHEFYPERDIPPRPYMISDAQPGGYYSNAYYPNPQDHLGRRYAAAEDGRDLRYAPPTPQYLYRPIREQGSAFGDSRDSARARSPAQHVKMEAVHSPARHTPSGATPNAYNLHVYGDSIDDRDPANGTTQFLSNFDVENAPAERRSTSDKVSAPERGSNNASSNRDDRTILGSRHLRDRLDPHEGPGTGTTSRKGTPRKAISRGRASARSRSPPVLPRSDPRDSEQPYLRRAADVPTDREPIQQAQYADARYYERPIYQDDLMPHHYEPMNRYRTRSPGRGSQHVSARYVEARPLPRYRYPDEDAYEQPGGDYIQVMPGENSRYVEPRMMHDPFPEYVADAATYGRVINNRDGQGYLGPTLPGREVRYDPYDDKRRYQ